MKNEPTKSGATELTEEDLEKVQGGGKDQGKAAFHLSLFDEQLGTPDANQAVDPVRNMTKAKHVPMMAIIQNNR